MPQLDYMQCINYTALQCMGGDMHDTTIHILSLENGVKETVTHLLLGSPLGSFLKPSSKNDWPLLSVDVTSLTLVKRI